MCIWFNYLCTSCLPSSDINNNIRIIILLLYFLRHGLSEYVLVHSDRYSAGNYKNNFNLSIFCFSVSLVFGIITMIAGIVGVPLGSILGTSLKKKYPRVDAIICGVGLILSAPLLLASLLLVRTHFTLTFVLIFFGQLFLNLNWSLVADILLVRYRTDFKYLLFFFYQSFL